MLTVEPGDVDWVQPERPMPPRIRKREQQKPEPAPKPISAPTEASAWVAQLFF